MFKRLLPRIGSAVLSIGMLTSLASDSLALDSKFYHGTLCVQRSQIGSSKMSYGPGGFKNDATVADDFVCPIVRDASSSTVSDWGVRVDRNGSTAAWSVRLKSCDYDGDVCKISTANVPATPTSGLILVDGGSVDSQIANGPMYIISSVPAGALIHSYRVTESGGTD